MFDSPRADGIAERPRRQYEETGGGCIDTYQVNSHTRSFPSQRQLRAFNCPEQAAVVDDR